MDTPKKIKWHNGLAFPSLEEGREALIQHTLDQGESFRVVKADHKRFFTCCNSGPECRYQIRLYVRRDTTAARVQLYKPKHTCSPDTHKGWVPPQYGPVNDEQSAPIQPESQPVQPEAAVPTLNGNDHRQVVDHPVDEAVDQTQQDKPKKSKKNKKNKKAVLSEEVPPHIVEDNLDAVIETTPNEKPKKTKKSKKGVPSEEPPQTVDPAVDAVIEVAPQEQPKKSKKNKKNAQSEELPPQIVEHPVDMEAEPTPEEQPKKSKNKKDKKSKKAKKAAEEDAVYEKLVADMERNKREYADDQKKIANWANHVDEQESRAWADDVQEREPTTYEKGLQTRREVLGNAHVDRSLAANSNAFSRPMQEVVTEFAWGNIWNREGLSRQQRSLMNIALLTALNRTPELAVHVRGAINNGLSELEIREAIIHSTVYCGAPAGMEAARTAERVLSEMQASGEHQRQLV